jgi:Ion channel
MSSWRDPLREPALTTMLVVQCLMIFVAAPVAAAGYPGSRPVLELLIFAFGLLVVLVSTGPITTTIAALSVIATLSRIIIVTVFKPSTSTLLIIQMGPIIATVIVAYVVGRAVLAPGRVTTHRVLGAIVLYLNFGLMFMIAYRLIWDVSPHSLNGIPAGIRPWQATGSIMYFSFVTLTTVGFGDITPVHPLVRGLANLEGIIGQLYPATLLARLITLELEGRREASKPASTDRSRSAATTPRRSAAGGTAERSRR